MLFTKAAERGRVSMSRESQNLRSVLSLGVCVCVCVYVCVCVCVCVEGTRLHIPTVSLYWALLDLSVGAGAGDTRQPQEQLRFSLWPVKRFLQTLSVVLVISMCRCVHTRLGTRHHQKGCGAMWVRERPEAAQTSERFLRTLCPEVRGQGLKKSCRGIDKTCE